MENEKDIVLDIQNVSMKFKLNSEKVDSLKEYMIKLVHGDVHKEEFWALKNVSFQVERGDRVAILGFNGAGKSTLLKVISGVFKPTEGQVIKHGNLVPLLELGAGFDRQYTGAENIYLYGATLGYTKKYIDEKYDRIVRFSRLGKFIDMPVKNYSSGMRARLGFSIATTVVPDILILDEVFAVGDGRFKRRSRKRLRKMMKKGVTVLFVSHSTEQLAKICNKAILLDEGQLIAQGDIDEMLALYESMLNADVPDDDSDDSDDDLDDDLENTDATDAPEKQKVVAYSKDESVNELISELSEEEERKLRRALRKKHKQKKKAMKKRAQKRRNNNE